MTGAEHYSLTRFWVDWFARKWRFAINDLSVLLVLVCHVTRVDNVGDRINRPLIFRLFGVQAVFAGQYWRSRATVHGSRHLSLPVHWPAIKAGPCNSGIGRHAIANAWALTIWAGDIFDATESLIR